MWAIFAFLLATFAQGALISMVSSIDSGQKVGVSAGLHAGGRRFLPQLAVRILLALPILIIGLLGAGTVITTASDLFNGSSQPLFNFGQFGAVTGLSVLGFLVILMMMAIGVGAERAVVLDEMSIGLSLIQGWKMLWSRLKDYLVIVVILIAVGVVAGLVFVCALVPIYLGSIYAHLGQVLSSQQNPQLVLTTVVRPTLIFALLFDVLLGTWATVFVSSVWTLAYRRWRGVELRQISPIEPSKPGDSVSTPAPNEPYCDRHHHSG